MALLFLKQALFGRSRHASNSYPPLLGASHPAPVDDPERGISPQRRSSDGGSSTAYDGSDVEDMNPDDKIGTGYASSSSTTSAHPGPASCRINPRIISDATIGLSDGLTVPFALTAGLSALGDARVVIYGGLAELIAGGISMGLGGYLGAKSEAEAYRAALNETEEIVSNDEARAAVMVRQAFADYALPGELLDGVANGLLAHPDRLVDFLMRFHHQLAEADYAPSRAYLSGLTISLGYFFGGLVPLLPYLFVSSVHDGFWASVIVMAVALFIFGWLKTALVGEGNRWTCLKNGVQMMVLGGVAAAAAVGCVKAIGT